MNGESRVTRREWEDFPGEGGGECKFELYFSKRPTNSFANALKASAPLAEAS